MFFEEYVGMDIWEMEKALEEKGYIVESSHATEDAFAEIVWWMDSQMCVAEFNEEDKCEMAYMVEDEG